MAIYYTVVCHTCKKRKSLAGSADSSVIIAVGEWARYRHLSHNISVLHDTSGWDDDYDKLYDEAMKYEEDHD
ncbi:hypothetical protein [Viridibacillus arvi]|uniref:hypothetical protein n=1 Tax=Viridibacillus arvi TaxID=263475 RepID=UPI0034CF064F